MNITTNAKDNNYWQLTITFRNIVLDIDVKDLVERWAECLWTRIPDRPSEIARLDCDQEDRMLVRRAGAHGGQVYSILFRSYARLRKHQKPKLTKQVRHDYIKLPSFP